MVDTSACAGWQGMTSTSELLVETGCQPGHVFQLALPDDNDLPTCLLEFKNLESITFDVSRKLGQPVIDVRRRSRGQAAAWVTVPETTVRQDDGTIFGQNDVRGSGKTFPMQAKAVAQPMKERTDSLLQPSVFGPDPRHQATSCFLVQLVHASGLQAVTPQFKARP